MRRVIADKAGKLDMPDIANKAQGYEYGTCKIGCEFLADGAVDISGNGNDAYLSGTGTPGAMYKVWGKDTPGRSPYLLGEGMVDRNGEFDYTDAGILAGPSQRFYSVEFNVE